MDFKQPDRPSGGRLAAGIILAVALGVASPALTLLSGALLLPVIMTGSLFMVFLFSFAGPVPAGLFTAIQLMIATLLAGSNYMWMTLLAAVMPAVIVIAGVQQKRPFFDQLRIAAVAHALGLVAAVFLAWSAYGGNMIWRMTESLKAQFSLMPNAFFEPFVEGLNSALSAGGLRGSELFTVESYRVQVTSMLDVLGEAYSRTLPGTLVAGALMTGPLSALWGNWLKARRGMATDESYIPVVRWFLPPALTSGLALMWLAAYVLTRLNYAAGETVYTAVYYVVSSAFAAQAIAALDRCYARRGLSAGKRRAMVVLGIVFGLALRILNLPLFIIGLVSALFGSRGTFRQGGDRGNDNHPDPGDSDR